MRSTENRIFRFSVIENVVMVAMAGLQVFVVRFFFQGARKGEGAAFFRLAWTMFGWLLIVHRLRMIEFSEGIW